MTGTVSNIVNTTYGNFDLVEGDAKIYIYGLLDLAGAAKNFASLGIAEGDVVTLKGVYTTFNNSPQIKNAQFISFVKGEGGSDDSGNDEGDKGEVLTSLVNGGFESWVSDTEAEGWYPSATSGTGNATLSKSTDARSGETAIVVEAYSTANKRLASKEMTLAAGTYKFSFYAKGTQDAVCQTRGGYVPVVDGVAGSYKYNSDFTNLNNSTWTLVEYEFTLEAETTVCLIVMNPKNSSYSTSQNIIVDDATLVKM